MAGVESDFLAERHDIYQRLKKGKRKEERGKRKERKEMVGNPPTFNSLSLCSILRWGGGAGPSHAPLSEYTPPRYTHSTQ